MSKKIRCKYCQERFESVDSAVEHTKQSHLDQASKDFEDRHTDKIIQKYFEQSVNEYEKAEKNAKIKDRILWLFIISFILTMIISYT